MKLVTLHYWFTQLIYKYVYNMHIITYKYILKKLQFKKGLKDNKNLKFFLKYWKLED